MCSMTSVDSCGGEDIPTTHLNDFVGVRIKNKHIPLGDPLRQPDPHADRQHLRLRQLRRLFRTQARVWFGETSQREKEDQK